MRPTIRPLSPVRVAGLLLAILATIPVTAPAARVTDIRWGRHDGFSRCVIEFRGEPARASLENRAADLKVVYCDLWGTEPYSDGQATLVDDPDIRSTQLAYFPADKRLRLAIKVGREARTQVITLVAPGRVVVDLFWEGTTAPRAAFVTGHPLTASGFGVKPGAIQVSAATAAAPKTGQEVVRIPVAPSEDREPVIPGGGLSASARVASPAPKGKPVIVLDPGHGGWHKGAVGKVGRQTVYEKEITLEIARRVKRKLDARGRYEVRLTRTSDVYLGLIERAQVAEDLNGDLFVSIHCNSVDGAEAARRVRGIEFWYWNRNGCSSAADKYLEELENEEGPGKGINGVTPSTRRLITSMMADQLEAMALRSARVCDTVSHAFSQVSYFRENSRGIKSARFRVLEIYQMPAILIEVGFLSNPWEAKRLANDDFQELAAQCLADGIDRVLRSGQE